MNRLEFFTEQYHKENERNKDIMSSLSMPISVNTSLFVGMFYLISTFDYTVNYVYVLLFSVLTILALYYFCYSIYYLANALSNKSKGYEYSYLPDPVALEKYAVELEKMQPNDLQKAEKTFEQYLIGELTQNTRINFENNKFKIENRYKCHVYMLYTFLAISVATVVYGLNSYQKMLNQTILKSKTIQKV